VAERSILSYVILGAVEGFGMPPGRADSYRFDVV
jgi:hypothetical protein